MLPSSLSPSSLFLLVSSQKRSVFNDQESWVRRETLPNVLNFPTRKAAYQNYNRQPRKWTLFFNVWRSCSTKIKPVVTYEVQPTHSKSLFKLARHTYFTKGYVIHCKAVLCCNTAVQTEIRQIPLLLKGILWRERTEYLQQSYSYILNF